MTYKCKICGGQATIDSNNGVVVCDYCGTKQALPLFTADSERLLYDRGNNYLLHSEYDKAENVFNQLLTIKPGAAELYWDLVLCKYGVTYVKDPKTGKYIPTCNRTHYTPIFSDENYKKAIELSSGEKKALFEEDAKTIDNIQKGIIAVSKKEKPFDIFISYKETDANGNRTKDSIEAQKLYEKLTEAGYKVFFSRITLEDKIGIEYEPYIYAALYSSKVMLTICSSGENIEAVWVKNEWSRFLGFRQNDNSKTLLPLYFDMEKADLPEEFALLSAYDMHTDGFVDELLRGIKKLIPLPIMKAKQRKQIMKATGIAAACVCAVTIGLTAIFLPGYLQDRKYQEAYMNAQALFENAQYEDASREFALLGDYRDSKEMVEKCAIQPDYDAAMQLYYDGKYAQATWAFEALGDYEDAVAQKEKAELSWREKLATIVAGSDYISANGDVRYFDSFLGSGNAGLEINKHGKVISIAYHTEALCALYEDGYVYNSAKNNRLDYDWEDVVQITPVFNKTSVALKADGTVVYGDLRKGEEYSDEWLEPVSTWRNIVALSWTINRWCIGDSVLVDMVFGMLVGIDAEGRVYTTCSYDENSTYEASMVALDLQRLDSLRDIEKIDVDYRICEKPYRHYSEILGWVEDSECWIEIDFVALDKYSGLISYIEGQYTHIEKANYLDAQINRGTVFVLDSKRKLSVLKSNAAILEDVVYMDEGYAVTRSGTIYYVGYDAVPESMGSKTAVKDVWLEENG